MFAVRTSKSHSASRALQESVGSCSYRSTPTIAQARRMAWAAAHSHDSCRFVANKRRSFHTSLPARAGEEDFDKTLEISRGASQKDVKAQFYKLSKRWHPDLNEGSDESKVKFQQVSEAYATLGNEQARKQYDRQTSAGGFSTPRRGTPRYPGSGFQSENLQRRATASYAWEYQRRNNARSQRHHPGQRRANDAHYHHDGPSGPSGGSSSTWGTGGAGPFSAPSSGAGAGAGAGGQSLFERILEQQRKREAALNARQGPQVNEERKMESQDMSSSHIVRFCQISIMFILIGSIVQLGRPKEEEIARKRLQAQLK